MRMKNLEKFLDFDGRRISVLNAADGEWYVAIKPICEVLNVDYIRQFKNLKEDEILGQLLSEQTTVAADGKVRNMTCLPEKFIYGWLFSIRSESEDLKKYKLKCYEVLYGFFHGTMKRRTAALKTKTDMDLEILTLKEQLDEKLAESEEYIRIQELKRAKKQVAQTLRELDEDLIRGQFAMDFG